jgi:tetratricopeptide (TPR) repeat protein
MLYLQSPRFQPWRGILTLLILSLLGTVSRLSALSGAGREPVLLHPHQPAFFHLPGGGAIDLTFETQADQAIEILIETSAPGAQFQVLAPSGKIVLVQIARDAEWEVVILQCAESGQYRLVAQPPDRNAGVSLRVDLLKFASADFDRRTAAAADFSLAQSFARATDSASLQAAIEKYRRAVVKWTADGDREGEALALMGEAKTWLNLSEYGKALAALKQARLVSLRIPFFRARMASTEAEVYLDRWDSQDAIRSAQEAMRLSRDLNDPWLVADAFVGRGEAEYLTDDASDRGDIENAIALSREIDADGTLARALRCKAWMEGDEGHVTHGMALMRQAEENFRTSGQGRNSVDAMANLATIQRMSGNYYAALQGHSSLIPLIRESGKLADLASVLVNTANDYLQLNRVPDAIAYYREGVGIFRKIGLLSGESIGMSQLCAAEERADSLRQAMRDCLQAKAIAEQLRDPKRLAVTILRLGNVQRRVGNPSQAIASFRQAYDISDSADDPRSQAQTLIEWGDVLESLGNRTQAREKFTKALPLSQKAEDVPEQIETLFRIAHSEYEAGEDDDAKADLNEALKNIDSQRRAVRNPDLQASYFAQLHKCHELYIELLMRENKRDPSPAAAAAKALEVSESGRALTLLDKLSDRGRIPALPKSGRPQELLEMQIAVERAYGERLNLMLEGAKKRDLDANEAMLTKAIDTLERTEDEGRSSVSAGRPLNAGEIAAASRGLDSTLVEYALGADHSYVWVIDHGKIESYILPARKMIESTVKKWRTLATARIAQPGASFDETRKRVETADLELPRVGARLSCMLLAPFLKPHMDHLAIVPDGELALLPFAALPENGCDGGAEPLAAGRQTVLVASLSILLLPHKPKERDSWHGEIALLADPVFDAGDPRVHSTGTAGRNDANRSRLILPRLYGTRDEATAIATLAGPDRSALYLDFDASLQTLLAPSLSQYRILHLATHGVLDEDAPGLSGIVLSLVDREGQPVFGYLKRQDVENLTLHSDLVVLSSCDSGSGPNFNGEGITGLTYAFLSAGATRVLSTLWSVDDETSKELIVGFYSAMFHDGLAPTDALRRSQMKLSRNPSTSAPYYWAGFTITTAF